MLDAPEALRAPLVQNPIRAWVGGKGTDDVPDFSFAGGSSGRNSISPGSWWSGGWRSGTWGEGLISKGSRASLISKTQARRSS